MARKSKLTGKYKNHSLCWECRKAYPSQCGFIKIIEATKAEEFLKENNITFNKENRFDGFKYYFTFRITVCPYYKGAELVG